MLSPRIPVLGACGLLIFANFATAASAVPDTIFRGGFEGVSTTAVDDPANFVGLYSSIAIGADGLPVISYHDSTAGVLKLAKCDDPACSGGNQTITAVDDPTNFVGSFSSLAIGADGLPVISYWDQTAFALKVAKCNDPACSGGDETITTVDGSDVLDRVGLYTSIAIGADGLPVISYIDQTAFALKVAKCNDPACSGGDEAISTVDDESVEFMGLYTSIAIGADELPVISYYFSDGALKVAKCNDPACAGGDESVTMVDYPAHRVGWDPSIAIGADGLPVISYCDSTAGKLKVAKCDDPACSSGNQIITTLDGTANFVGLYSSIAIGADGLPVISYYDSTAGVLKVAKCDDPACSGASETIATDGSAHRVGPFTSIAIGADGLPVISYRDATTRALMVTKCADPACSGGAAAK